VVAAVAPAAALLFSGAAAWASLTAPEPSHAASGAGASTAAPEAATTNGADPSIAKLARRLEADRKRLDALRVRLAARSSSGGGRSAVVPAGREPQAAPAPARPRPAPPPPPVDTSTGASG